MKQISSDKWITEKEGIFLKVMFLADGGNWEGLFQGYTAHKNADLEDNALYCFHYYVCK